jgi:hypothetical protein
MTVYIPKVELPFYYEHFNDNYGTENVVDGFENFYERVVLI